MGGSEEVDGSRDVEGSERRRRREPRVNIRDRRCRESRRTFGMALFGSSTATKDRGRKVEGEGKGGGEEDELVHLLLSFLLSFLEYSGRILTEVNLGSKEFFFKGSLAKL